jgi:hypothetical protein
MQYKLWLMVSCLYCWLRLSEMLLTRFLFRLLHLLLGDPEALTIPDVELHFFEDMGDNGGGLPSSHN